jgi:hypothetical protein
MITAHLTKEPRDLRALRQDVDPELADLLKRCLAREANHRPSASDVVRILDGELASAPGAATEAVGLDLLKKKMHWAVAAAGTVGFVLFQVTGDLADRGIISESAYRRSLVFIVGGFVASLVGAWFHGEAGKQRAPVIEWVLYGLITVACVLIALAL